MTAVSQVTHTDTSSANVMMHHKSLTQTKTPPLQTPLLTISAAKHVHLIQLQDHSGSICAWETLETSRKRLRTVANNCGRLRSQTQFLVNLRCAFGKSGTNDGPSNHVGLKNARPQQTHFSSERRQGQRKTQPSTTNFDNQFMENCSWQSTHDPISHPINHFHHHGVYLDLYFPLPD